jgi:hypothetical protein
MLSTAYPFSEVDLFCDVEALTPKTSGADIAQTCVVQPESLVPLGTVITPESDQLRVEGFSELEFQYMYFTTFYVRAHIALATARRCPAQLRSRNLTTFLISIPCFLLGFARWSNGDVPVTSCASDPTRFSSSLHFPVCS